MVQDTNVMDNHVEMDVFRTEGILHAIVMDIIVTTIQEVVQVIIIVQEDTIIARLIQITLVEVDV